ncbi:ABC transporter ATP-binding protein [Mumia zhuanghuii]|uniref:Oligopeptide/dipeptide ABC transporter ATP-binding protein n=2 Tax=Mumia TaxID=1546255 RepID=A0ABW1QP52_9ACTN|nr:MULTISPECIES: ABC transporter ATP-binding protein [Mumia]KAA1423734.1 ABC transporter ATP-binding protein [Mumia zhuanghuii]
MSPVIALEGLAKGYDIAGGARLTAVDDVSLTIAAGETYALVGESGCGKSTLARMAAMLTAPDAGQVSWSGQTVSQQRRSAVRAVRDHTQFVFQDPAAALSPRLTVEEAVSEPLRIRRRTGSRSVADLLDDVGLDRSMGRRYPRELSGGQRQRVVIARALALEPKLLVLDEPVASLDVSVQAQVLNLLADLQAEHGLAYLLIAHDLAVVSSVADRIGVMYLGQIVEEGPAGDVVTTPRHPYTQMLIASVPAFVPGERGERPRVVGDPASPTERRTGCAFATRCAFATQVCLDVAPPRRELGDVAVRCHHAS